MARRISMSGRLARWARRNRKLAVSLSAVTMLTIILTVGSLHSTYYYYRQQRKQTALRAAAERSQYFAEMNVVGVASRERDGIGRVVELTEYWRPGHAGIDYRGWEWYYLRSCVEDDAFTFSGIEDPVWDAVWSPDSTQLVSTFSEGFQVWDVARKQRRETLHVHTGMAYALSWSPDGTRLASASADRSVKIWNVSTWEEVISLEGCQEGSEWWHVVWSPGGSMVAASSWNSAADTGKVMTWDATTGRRLSIGPGSGSINWTTNESQLALARPSGLIELWDVHTGEIVGTIGQHSPVITCVRWSPDGTRFASSSDDGSVRIWDGQRIWAAYETAKPVHILSGHGNNVIQVNWSPDSRWLASASRDGTVNVWDTATGQAIRTLKGHTDNVLTVTWSPDGKKLASAGDDHRVKIWNVDSELSTRAFTGHTHQVWEVRLSPEDAHVADGGGPIVRVWDLVSSAGKPRKHVDHAGRVAHTTWRWSPAGRRFVTMSDDGTPRVWDASTAQCTGILRGHSRIVTAADWSPDGARIATVSYDGTLKIWDSETGRIALTLRGKDSRVFGVRWSPDSRSIATVGDHQTITIWDASKAYEREGP